MTTRNARLDSTRYNFTGTITREEIRDLVNDAQIKTIQTAEPTEPSTWDLLNRELFSVRSDIDLRVFGWYGKVCDLTFLTGMGSVRGFTADCIMNGTGEEYIAELPQLERLGIGIYNLTSFDFLNRLPTSQIKELSLEATASKRPDLQALASFTNLKKLYIEGHQKGIEVIATLSNLEDLTLRSVSPPDLSFLQSLHSLWSLDIKLGGARDLAGIAGMNQIKYLELWQIKGLHDVGAVSTLQGLQYLFLQALANVTALPELTNLKKLRRIYCENLKTLTDVNSLKTASALEELFISGLRGTEPEEFEWIFKLPTLKRATIASGGSARFFRFQQLAEKHSVKPWDWKGFQFN